MAAEDSSPKDVPSAAAQTMAAEDSPPKDVPSSAAAQQEEMDVETLDAKRPREEESENGNEAKKAKVEEDKSVEEQRLEKHTQTALPVSVGYKTFNQSVEMFDYFFKFLRYWPPNLNLNKYEHAMLLDLLKKGHLEAERKIGTGVVAFQVRYHPEWKTQCFYIVRDDGSAEDFSFRKCVDHILPLPENMVVKPDVNKALGGGGRGGGGRGGGRGNWRGRGRGGKQRN